VLSPINLHHLDAASDSFHFWVPSIIFTGIVVEDLVPEGEGPGQDLEFRLNTDLESRNGKARKGTVTIWDLLFSTGKA
jgi:hypothetical protein